MSYDWAMAIVVYIRFHAFNSAFQILDVPLYLRITCELIARQIGIMGRVAKIVS
jgi:hypothetical protein